MDMIDALHREPWTSIIEHVRAMSKAIMRSTGGCGITRISVTPELGRMLDLAPGHSCDVLTDCGPVEIYVERGTRSAGTAVIG